MTIWPLLSHHSVQILKPEVQGFGRYKGTAPNHKLVPDSLGPRSTGLSHEGDICSPKAMINPAELAELSAVRPLPWTVPTLPVRVFVSYLLFLHLPFITRPGAAGAGEPLGNSKADSSHFSLPASVGHVTTPGDTTYIEDPAGLSLWCM